VTAFTKKLVSVFRLFLQLRVKSKFLLIFYSCFNARAITKASVNRTNARKHLQSFSLKHEIARFATQDSWNDLGGYPSLKSFRKFWAGRGLSTRRVLPWPTRFYQQITRTRELATL